MSELTVYQKPTCTTCRKVYKALQENGVDFDAVNYYIEPISKTKLKDLLEKMGMTAEELVRKKEAVYKEQVAGKGLSNEELIDLMAANPDLIERPIVEKGAKAILARPAERISEIL